MLAHTHREACGRLRLRLRIQPHLKKLFLASRVSRQPFSSVQFSSVQLDARGCLAWTSLGYYFISSIIIFKVQFSSLHFTSLHFTSLYCVFVFLRSLCIQSSVQTLAQRAALDGVPFRPSHRRPSKSKRACMRYGRASVKMHRRPGGGGVGAPIGMTYRETCYGLAWEKKKGFDQMDEGAHLMSHIVPLQFHPYHTIPA